MPENVTVSTFLARWLRDYGTAVRPTTLGGYRMIVQKHLAPILGHVRLDRLTPGMIQRYLTQKTEGDGGKALSFSTVRKHAAVLHKGLRQGVEWGMLAANPCDRVDALHPRRFGPTV